MNNKKDIGIVRDLAKQYAEIASLPEQNEKIRLWSSLNSLKSRKPAVHFTFGMWNVWCRDVFNDDKMKCEDPFYRSWERNFRMSIFHHDSGDDTIYRPWISMRADVAGGWDDLWGVYMGNTHTEDKGGAWKYDPPIKTWDDVKKLNKPVHGVDEKKTAEHLSKLHEAVGGILPIDVSRSPVAMGFLGDISTCIAKLLGLEQLMIYMYESPDELHKLLAFMRDGILENQDAAEKAGHFSLTSHSSQEPTYCDELKHPTPNSGSVMRKELMYFAAAQEYTLISPAMHEEFLLQYQLPIIKNYAMSSYGCCENLTEKISMLRKIPNLRTIAVTPTANVARCVEQIGDDYVMSWRPNPTDMVCGDWDEARIRRVLTEGVKSLKGHHFCIHLKDVETVEGDTSRLKKWVKIVREVLEETM